MFVYEMRQGIAYRILGFQASLGESFSVGCWVHKASCCNSPDLMIPRPVLFFLLLISSIPALLGQIKSPPRTTVQAEWQKALELLQRNAVKDLLPLSKLLENELLEQKQIAVAAGDQARSAELDTRITVFQDRQRPLCEGKLWMPKSQEVNWDVFYREAAGKRWALQGTKAVKQFRCEGKDLLLSIENCQAFRHPQTATWMPRVYATRRSSTSGPGYSVYLVSPDLRQAHCLVVSRIYQTSFMTPPRQTSLFSKAGNPLSVVDDTDLLSVLTSSFTEKQREHSQRIMSMLDTELNERFKARSKEPMSDLLRALIDHRTALAYHSGQIPAATSLTVESFVERVKKANWVISGLGRGSHWQFDGKFLRSRDSLGKEMEMTPAEVVWPGLVRTTSGSSPTRYLVVSDDFREAMILPATAVFLGKVVE